MRRQSFAIPCALAIALLVISGAAPALMAQDQDRGQGQGDPKTGACNPALNFVFGGAGPASFNICLSSEGNVVDQIGPSPFNHQLGYEGYRLCTVTGDYWDLGNLGQSGWGAPTVVQPKGAGKLPVTITRTTTNGQWSLKQTFAKDNTERDFTVTMALKKLNGPIGPTVYLQRWSDLDVDSSFGGDTGDRSVDSIYARQSRAISLTAITYALPRTTGVGNFAYGSGDCVAASAAVPIGPTDISGRVTYNLGGFNNNQTKTVKFRWSIQ